IIDDFARLSPHKTRHRHVKPVLGGFDDELLTGVQRGVGSTHDGAIGLDQVVDLRLADAHGPPRVNADQPDMDVCRIVDRGNPDPIRRIILELKVDRRKIYGRVQANPSEWRLTVMGDPVEVMVSANQRKASPVYRLENS